jgi:hypothetical protein
MTWNPLDQPIDYVVLGGQKTPGLATIVGASSPRKWDERAGYALSGATVWYHGLGLARFSLMLRLYTAEEWAAWDAFRPLVATPPRTRAAKGLQIEHPLLAHVGITAVVVDELMAPEQTDDGEWTIEIRLIEFRQPKVALAKPDAATATPVDPVEEEIGKLTTQFQTLANQ